MLNVGNSATACFQRLANLQLDPTTNATATAAAAAWVMAVGGTGGVSAEDVWQIIASLSSGSSSTGQYLPEAGGCWVHAMACSMLCGGPDFLADASLANRSLFSHVLRDLSCLYTLFVVFDHLFECYHVVVVMVAQEYDSGGCALGTRSRSAATRTCRQHFCRIQRGGRWEDCDGCGRSSSTTDVVW